MAVVLYTMLYFLSELTNKNLTRWN